MEYEVLTIPEMSKRLKITKENAYNLVQTSGFPLLDLGGERGKRVIWVDVLEWLRKNNGTNGVEKSA